MILRELKFPYYKTEKKKVATTEFYGQQFRNFQHSASLAKIREIAIFNSPKNLFPQGISMEKALKNNKLLQKQAIIPIRRSVENESSDVNFSKDQANKN